jgi:hypothetical protein
MSTPQACGAAGVTLRQADHWVTRRALPLSAHGCGTRMRWEIADVAQLAVIGRCTDAGLNLQRGFACGWAARRALDDGQHHICVLVAPSTPPPVSQPRAGPGRRRRQRRTAGHRHQPARHPRPGPRPHLTCP